MIGDFIVSHPGMTTFALTNEEWNNAIKESPDLLQDDDMNFLPKTATSIITPSKESYFDNDCILKQFQRLIILMRFSEIFQQVDFRVDLIVDNATTHTKALVDVSMFGKSINTASPVEELFWYDENNNQHSLNCFFQNGEHQGKSKGLFVMSKELELIPENMLPKQIKLKDLRESASQHPAFIRKSKLENLIDE